MSDKYTKAKEYVNSWIREGSLKRATLVEGSEVYSRPLNYTIHDFEQLFKYTLNRGTVFAKKNVDKIESVIGYKTPTVLVYLLEEIKKLPLYVIYALAIAYHQLFTDGYISDSIFLNFVYNGPTPPDTASKKITDQWGKWMAEKNPEQLQPQRLLSQQPQPHSRPWRTREEVFETLAERRRKKMETHVTNVKASSQVVAPKNIIKNIPTTKKETSMKIHKILEVQKEKVYSRPSLNGSREPQLRTSKTRVSRKRSIGCSSSRSHTIAPHTRQLKFSQTTKAADNKSSTRLRHSRTLRSKRRSIIPQPVKQPRQPRQPVRQPRQVRQPVRQPRQVQQPVQQTSQFEIPATPQIRSMNMQDLLQKEAEIIARIQASFTK